MAAVTNYHEFGGLEQQRCILSWAGTRVTIYFAAPKSRCGRAPPGGPRRESIPSLPASAVVLFCWWPCHCSPRLPFSWVVVPEPPAPLIRCLVIAFRAHSDNLCHLKVRSLNHLPKDLFPYKLIFMGSGLGPNIFEDHFSAHYGLLWSS